MTQRASEIDELVAMYNALRDSGINPEEAAQMVDEELLQRIAARKVREAAQVWASRAQIASAKMQVRR